MKKIIAYLNLFFDLITNSSKRKLFFGSEFNKNVMYKRYGITPYQRVKKVAVIINVDGEEKVHIIEEKIT